MMRQMKHIDRRAFMKLAGCATASAALPLVSPAIGMASLNRRLKVAQQTRLLMGTLVSVTVIDPSAHRAQAAMAAAFERMTALTPLFDRHGSGGAVKELNTSGSLDKIPQLTQLLEACSKVHHATNGAFDVTVAPLLDLYRTSHAQGGKPDAKDIQAALKAIGGLTSQGQRLVLTKPGAAITLDGVAKGFIADAGLAAIRAKGATRALINAGGDVVLMGDRGQKRPWRVAVADPQAPTKPKVICSMTQGALATSGNYEVFFDREKLFHHIVDPTSGQSPRTDASVSVRAPSGLLADALSTACFVMKPNQAMAFVRSRPQVEALILTRMGQRIESKGFRS